MNKSRERRFETGREGNRESIGQKYVWDGWNKIMHLKQAACMVERRRRGRGGWGGWGGWGGRGREGEGEAREVRSEGGL